MKKILHLTAFLLAFILILSISMPIALAADQTDKPLETSSSISSQYKLKIEELKNRFEIAKFKTEIIKLVNKERENMGVKKLEEMNILHNMADIRAKESSVSFNHIRPDGTRCFTIFAENSLKYHAAGENLSFGFKTPEDIVNAWMNSETHRRNILDPDFKYIGIGYYTNSNRIYCSELFYTPQSVE